MRFIYMAKQNFFAQGKVPEEWKSANVVPIFKKGSKSVADI